MTHVDEGVLQGFADGELPDHQLDEVERHLERCDRCRDELRELRGHGAAFAGAMSALDGAGLRIGAEPPPLRRRNAAAGRWGGALPRAAVLVLGFAAAASATLPGSPVRRWLSSLDEPETIQTTPSPAPAAAPPAAVAAAAVEEPESGVSVAPEAGAVRVILRDASPSLRVRAVLTDGARAGVFATGAVTGARFSTAPGRIEVSGAGAGELRIELPRAAVRATVEVNGRPYLVKEGDQLRLSVPADERAATEVTFRVQP